MRYIVALSVWLGLAGVAGYVFKYTLEQPLLPLVRMTLFSLAVYAVWKICFILFCELETPLHRQRHH